MKANEASGMQTLFFLALVFHELKAMVTGLSRHFVRQLLQKLIKGPRECPLALSFAFLFWKFALGDACSSSTDIVCEILSLTLVSFGCEDVITV